MIDFDRIREVKNAAQDSLFARPGVHAVAIGAKIVAGKRTAEPAIAVFVVRKKPIGELSPGQVIPRKIDGIKTDVIAASIPRTQAGPPGDNEVYRPLVGGIRIRPGGEISADGTLGCLARTNGAQSKIVGVTCEHVVAPALSQLTSLQVEHTPGSNTWTFAGTNTPGSLIAVEIQAGTRATFVTTIANQTLESIAESVRDAVHALTDADVSATVSGRTVTISINASDTAHNVGVFGPPRPDSKSKLSATVSSPSPASHVIRLTGSTKDGRGVYTRVNLGGPQNTFGVFAAVRKSDGLHALATKIAAALTTLITQQAIPGVSASASGAQISINGARAVLCYVKSDTRVGQPDKTFGWCTNHRIGRVLNARLDFDAAIVELDAGLKYKAEIAGLGAVRGIHTVTAAEATAGFPVRTRGAHTGAPVTGKVNHIDKTGFAFDQSPGGVFGRRYSGALLIDVQPFEVFTQRGDSGAAVVTPGGEVVGILFASSIEENPQRILGVATPIEAVVSALDITLETVPQGQAEAEERVVPVTPGTPREMLGEDEMDGAGIAARPGAALRDRLMEVGTEIAGTPAGREYAEIVQRHIPETQQLINTHPRVGAVWRRNGGNQIVQGFLEVVQIPDRTLPCVINGRPLTECLRRIQRALARYGSAELIADLGRYGPTILTFSGLTYAQMVASLRRVELRSELR